MRLVEQQFNVIEMTKFPAELVEIAGRVCYDSFDKMTDDSAQKMVRSLLKRGHNSVIEHAVASALIITDRGISHELVRHRLGSYSQRSTRYVDSGDNSIEFIRPSWMTADPELYTDAERDFVDALTMAECFYKSLRAAGWKKEQARNVLPNATKTVLVMTCNMREWRHIFKLRLSPAAHPQMRELMALGLRQFKQLAPVFFEDIPGDTEVLI